MLIRTAADLLLIQHRGPAPCGALHLPAGPVTEAGARPAGKRAGCRAGAHKAPAPCPAVMYLLLPERPKKAGQQGRDRKTISEPVRLVPESIPVHELGLVLILD